MILLLLGLMSFSAFSQDYPECAFYAKMDEQTQCEGKQNYLLNYGMKYCQKFSDLSQRVSSDSKLSQWIGNTRQCLIQMLEKNPERYENNCFLLKEFAFDTHPICYKQYGVCDLELKEIFKIMKTTIGGVLKDRRLNSIQTRNVLLACLAGHSKMAHNGQEFFKRVDLDSSRLSNESIENFISIVDLAPEDPTLMNEFYGELKNSSSPISNKLLQKLNLENEFFPLNDLDSSRVLNKAILLRNVQFETKQ